ncbi:MAG: RNA recognition motif domain-containing protein [Sandaracinaceae bacterium]
MSTPNKRARENNKARKKRDKQERRWEKRHEGPRSIPVSAAEEIPSMSVEEIMASMDSPRGTPTGIPSKLFVRGLSSETTGATLRAAFAEHGEVLEAVVINDRDTGRSRGFGFVTMASHKTVPAVIRAMHGAELDGRSISVDIATDSGR